MTEAKSKRKQKPAIQPAVKPDPLKVDTDNLEALLIQIRDRLDFICNDIRRNNL
ncbi:MAG: hypothetical protein R6U93_09200 [Dehalococcoidia bacterium]